MDTEPEFSQRNYYESKHPQCPNCGRYKPGQAVHYENPRTGERVHDAGPNVFYGCLIWIASLIIMSLVVGNLCVIAFSIPTGSFYNPLAGDAAFFGIPFAICGSVVPIVFFVLHHDRTLRKNNITVTEYLCNSCKKRWVVTQQPTAKEVS